MLKTIQLLKATGLSIPILILLLCPGITLALTANNKAEIIQEEWKAAVQPLAGGAGHTIESLQQDKTVKKQEHLPGVFYKNITIRSNGISLRVVLQKITKSAGYNIIYSPGVEADKMVLADIVDVPIWRALNTILFPLTYGYKITDKDLVILAEETRSYKVTLPPNTQSFSDTISNESYTQDVENANSSENARSSVKVGARIFVESKEEELSLWKDIEKNITKMISKNGSYTLNKQAGVVMVTDNPVILDKIGKFFDLVNTEAGKEILCEVKVVEVTLTKKSAYGIDWNALYKHIASIRSLGIASNFAATGIASGNMFTLSASAPNPDSGTTNPGLNAAIRALETQGKVKVVSQPKLMLLNNQSAVIQVGKVTGYVSETTTSVSQGISTTSAKTDQVQEGVSLRLIASILDKEIAIQLTPVITTVDEIRSITVGSTTIEAPKTSTKSMHSLVRIKDGETIAIGGLITSKDDKSEKGIPVLRKIPVLGRIFDYKSDTQTNTELVIFITPKILN